ncbi:hypothetical protein GPALN_007731 [Globodera pallida]|nr:hypothetical protein GPALN_007731 [Globodera pallida]
MKLHECHRQIILFIFVNVGARASPSVGDSIGAGPGNFGSGGTGLGSASRVESFKMSFVSSLAANTDYYHNRPFDYYGNHYYLGGDGASKLNSGEIQAL